MRWMDERNIHRTFSCMSYILQHNLGFTSCFYLPFYLPFISRILKVYSQHIDSKHKSFAAKITKILDLIYHCAASNVILSALFTFHLDIPRVQVIPSLSMTAMVLYFYLHVFVGRMASSIQRKRVGFNLTRYFILTLKERLHVKIRIIF